MKLKLYSFDAKCGETDWVAAYSPEEAKEILINFQEDMAEDGEYEGVEGVEVSDEEMTKQTMFYDEEGTGEPEGKDISFKEALDVMTSPGHVASTIFC